MFLLIVIIILIAATSILGNIYVGIFPFLQNYGDLENYSNSQYAAVSSIERGLLVAKYKHPSFVGSGGFLGTGSWGEESDLFSGTFGKYNQEENGTYRNIDSQCDTETGILRNDDVLVFNTYNYNTTPAYTGDNETTSDSISTTSKLNGTFSTISSINLIKGNVYRQVEGDDKINNYTGFIAGSGNTLISYTAIDDSSNINIYQDTKNPVARLSGDILCTQDGCYANQTISDLIGTNNDKGVIFYIKERMIDGTNNGSIGTGINYYLTNDRGGSCQNYDILGTAIIGKYKQEIEIQKPSFNYKNPNQKKFIFPYYN